MARKTGQLAPLADAAALFALPHPQRMVACGALTHFRQGLGAFGALALEEMLADPRLTKGTVMRKLASLPWLREALADPSGRVNLAQLEPLLTPLRYHALNGRIFEVRPELDRLLAATDIGSQSPARFFRAPYPALYLLFGAAGDGLTVLNESEGVRYALEGAYLTELTVDEDYPELGLFEGLGGCGPTRLCEITLIGKPRRDPFDDGYVFARLLFPDRWAEDPLDALIDRQLAMYETQGLSGLGEGGRQCLRAGVFHVAKTLLYLNSEQARTSAHNEEQDLRERLERVKGGKRAKLERRLARAYDRVLVGPESSASPTTGLGAGHAITSHWRRGHFRSQAHGEGRLLRKLIWIAPTLVAGVGGPPLQKTYYVK